MTYDLLLARNDNKMLCGSKKEIPIKLLLLGAKRHFYVCFDCYPVPTLKWPRWLICKNFYLNKFIPVGIPRIGK